MYIEKQSVWFGLGNKAHIRVRVAHVYKNGEGERVVRVALLNAPGGMVDLPASEFTSRYAPDPAVAVAPAQGGQCKRERVLWSPGGATIVSVRG